MGRGTQHVTQRAKTRLRSGGMAQGQDEGSSESQRKAIWDFSKVEVEFFSLGQRFVLPVPWRWTMMKPYRIAESQDGKSLYL